MATDPNQRRERAKALREQAQARRRAAAELREAAERVRHEARSLLSRTPPTVPDAARRAHDGDV
jgi:hypothetical protein